MLGVKLQFPPWGCSEFTEDFTANTKSFHKPRLNFKQLFFMNIKLCSRYITLNSKMFKYFETYYCTSENKKTQYIRVYVLTSKAEEKIWSILNIMVCSPYCTVYYIYYTYTQA